MKKLSTIILALFLATTIVHAEPAPFDQNNYVFVIHLYYDNGNLVFNRDSQLKYEVSLGDYAPTTQTATSYTAELVSTSGSTNKIYFDPTGGNPNFKKGALDVKAPYT